MCIYATLMLHLYYMCSCKIKGRWSERRKIEPNIYFVNYAVQLEKHVGSIVWRNPIETNKCHKWLRTSSPRFRVTNSLTDSSFSGIGSLPSLVPELVTANIYFRRCSKLYAKPSLNPTAPNPALATQKLQNSGAEVFPRSKARRICGQSPRKQKGRKDPGVMDSAWRAEIPKQNQELKWRKAPDLPRQR